MSTPAPDPLPETLGGQPTRSRSGGRGALAIGATVLGVALVGGGAYAAWSFLSTDAQPAEALPAGTVGYLALDTDPGGGQKIEAYRTLRKFPALEDELGPAGREDLREVVVDALLDDVGCDLSFDDDVADWMGDRLALAAVPDDDEIVPVVAVEVTDVDAAEDGLAALRDCADEELGWAFRDDFALIGPTDDQARSIAAAAGDAALADDPDFQSWTDEAGTGGIVTGYAAPDLGEHLIKVFDELEDLGPSAVPGAPEDPDALRAEVERTLGEFRGAGLGVRFEDGSLVVSAAAGGLESVGDPGATVGPLVSGLPDSTGLVLAFAVGEGWAEQLRENLGAAGLDDLLGPGGGASGFDLADLEALLGDGVALVADGNVDVEALDESFDPRQLPVGVKVAGDQDEVGDAVDRLMRDLGAAALMVRTERADGAVVVGPSPDYLTMLLGEGDLGAQERFRAVVPEAERADSVLFLDLETDWVDVFADEDPELAANLEPLDALGASSWTDADDVVRGRIVLSTD